MQLKSLRQSGFRNGQIQVLKWSFAQMNSNYPSTEKVSKQAGTEGRTTKLSASWITGCFSDQEDQRYLVPPASTCLIPPPNSLWCPHSVFLISNYSGFLPPLGINSSPRVPAGRPCGHFDLSSFSFSGSDFRVPSPRTCSLIWASSLILFPSSQLLKISPKWTFTNMWNRHFCYSGSPKNLLCVRQRKIKSWTLFQATQTSQTSPFPPKLCSHNSNWSLDLKPCLVFQASFCFHNSGFLFDVVPWADSAKWACALPVFSGSPIPDPGHTPVWPVFPSQHPAELAILQPCLTKPL